MKESGSHLPALEMNSYAFYHAMGVYEGQRSTGSEKRVFNLTRSGHTGQQRFGTVLWSGDIAAIWDTLRRQIATGLGLCASGMPYWTVYNALLAVNRLRYELMPYIYSLEGRTWLNDESRMRYLAFDYL